MIILDPKTIRQQRNKGKITHVLAWVIILASLVFLGLFYHALIVGVLWGVLVVIHLLQ